MSPEQVAAIARLARLEIDSGDEQAYARNLTRILDFVAQLESADTSGVTPMAHPLDMVQRMREDEVTGDIDRDRYQANAPLAEDGIYLVPRVIE